MVFASKFSGLSFSTSHVASSGNTASLRLTDDDDMDLCLYYLRTLSNVFKWAPDGIWAVLASKSVTVDEGRSPMFSNSKLIVLVDWQHPLT
jgi:hypothetical protein